MKHGGVMIAHLLHKLPANHILIYILCLIFMTHIAGLRNNHSPPTTALILPYFSYLFLVLPPTSISSLKDLPGLLELHGDARPDGWVQDRTPHHEGSQRVCVSVLYMCCVCMCQQADLCVTFHCISSPRVLLMVAMIALSCEDRDPVRAHRLSHYPHTPYPNYTPHPNRTPTHQAIEFEVKRAEHRDEERKEKNAQFDADLSAARKTAPQDR